MLKMVWSSDSFTDYSIIHLNTLKKEKLDSFEQPPYFSFFERNRVNIWNTLFV